MIPEKEGSFRPVHDNTLMANDTVYPIVNTPDGVDLPGIPHALMIALVAKSLEDDSEMV